MTSRRIISFIPGITMIITGVYCLFTPAMTYHRMKIADYFKGLKSRHTK